MMETSQVKSKTMMLINIPLIISCFSFDHAMAQNMFQRVDRILTEHYRKGDIDTTYITRPNTKWTIVGRINVSGTKIEAEGIEEDRHFKSEMIADRKTTLSACISYLGFSVSMALNPAKLLGKYNDYELNFNSYGRRFGFDIIFQNAHNFSGWHENDGQERITLPTDLLSLKTLNLNAFYIFNNRRFSYPAAFSQSYIQQQSSGSFLLAASGQGQRGSINREQKMLLKMTNIGIGAGYGYNYVPFERWLLHISALPTFIIYSNTSMTFNDSYVPLHYHFPEVIITGRGAVVRQIGNKFFGLSMVFNFTNIGNEKSLAVHNIKWRIRTFFGFRL